MTTTRRRTAALALATAWLGLLIAAGTAGGAAAATSVTSGWWTTSPFLLAPDVGDGQLLVQAGRSVEEPLAYAGISFVLDDGEVPESLFLEIAPDSLSSPAAALLLCALDGPATDAAGDSADGAPAPECDIEVEGVATEDGNGFEFDVTAFPAEGSLDVAVVPGGPGDRVVLQAPTVLSLSGQIPFDSGSGSVSSPAPSGPSAPAPGGSSAPSATGGGSSAPSSSFTAPPSSPSVTVAPVAPDAGSESSPTAGAADEGAAAPVQSPEPFQGVPAASQGSGGGGGLAPVLFAGLAALAGILWSMAGKTSDDAPHDAAPAT